MAAVTSDTAAAAAAVLIQVMKAMTTMRRKPNKTSEDAFVSHVPTCTTERTQSTRHLQGMPQIGIVPVILGPRVSALNTLTLSSKLTL